MSRGISWRQRTMLESIAFNSTFSRSAWGRKPAKKPVEEPVPWREIDYGPGGEANYFTARGAWNREQTVRRALRSLERRGLVTLDRYVFSFHGDDWGCLEPDRHIPGDTRIMTGALLTEAGWAVVRAAVAAPQERAG